MRWKLYPLTTLATVMYDLIDGMFICRDWKGHFWASPDELHLRQLMRQVVMNPSEVLHKGELARIDMKQKYSLLVVGNLLGQHVERISRKLSKTKEDESSIDHQEL